MLQQALAHHSASRLADAEKLYREILQAEPRCSPAWHLLGVIAHQMSGSGSSYFGWCAHAAQARRLAARLRQRGVGRVFAISSVV